MATSIASIQAIPVRNLKSQKSMRRVIVGRMHAVPPFRCSGGCGCDTTVNSPEHRPPTNSQETEPSKPCAGAVFPPGAAAVLCSLLLLGPAPPAALALPFGLTQPSDQTQQQQQQQQQLPQNVNGWEAFTAADGSTYYYNAMRNQSMWGIPPEDRINGEVTPKLAAPSAPPSGVPALAPSPSTSPSSQTEFARKYYTPEKQDLDKSGLYKELVFTIALTFGLTLFLENSGLFPTIVAANQQFTAADQAMQQQTTEPMIEDTIEEPLNPSDKMQSMIGDARGGLEMVQNELGSREKVEK